MCKEGRAAPSIAKITSQAERTVQNKNGKRKRKEKACIGLQGTATQAICTYTEA
jgi:hypothetical protein